MADILQRKKTEFILWRPSRTSRLVPKLFIGTASNSRIGAFNTFRSFDLQQSEPRQFPELWSIAAAECDLTSGEVYHYWFTVADSNVTNESHLTQVINCTDPMALAVDGTIKAPSPMQTSADLIDLNPVSNPYAPASVVLFKDGQLLPSDSDGVEIDLPDDSALIEALPPNNRIVIYELPTRWTRQNPDASREEGRGTFQDTRALLDPTVSAPDFPDLDVLGVGQAYLRRLGVNALELLPLEDSEQNLRWGYGTSNYFAADWQLGQPVGQDIPTPTRALVGLIQLCHENGIRFFADIVMAFCLSSPLRNVNFLDFLVQFNTNDPEQDNRDAFGGDLIKFRFFADGYDPINGTRANIVPSRQYLKAHIEHWLNFFRVDGLRLDSVNNINDYNFLEEFRDFSRQIWSARDGSSDARFLVVGEELSVPAALLEQDRLDGQWNEIFKQIVRKVIIGRNWDGEPSFEWSVRKMIDCRQLGRGFDDLSQAVNYITSHDVGGFENERLFNYLDVNGAAFDKEKRAKLAFVCLLTAVGIPMILAGDEFVDQQDLDIINDPSGVARNKQVDPVNFARANEDWRERVFNLVARLVRLRTTYDALSVNDTEFIHVDFSEGKRVLAWVRGNRSDNLVIVVANFSDFNSPMGGEYFVQNWPATPPGMVWREMSQENDGRDLATARVAREEVFAWEAKVYALFPSS